MPLHIPLSGSISLESTLPPKLDIVTGAKSHIFQPPRTPSASTSLHRSSAFLQSKHGSGAASRKRPRKDSYLSEEPLSNTYDTNAWSPMESVLPSSVISPGDTSPAPFVNTQYKLAGGLDTPTAAFSSVLERSDHYATSDSTMRGGRGWGRSSGICSDNYFPQMNSPILEREGNGRPRFRTSQQPSSGGWGKTVFNVAGKVWEFCKTSAFRGFYAGGGQGYAMQPPNQSEQSMWDEVSEAKDYFFGKEDITSLPGRFPDEDFISDYISQDHYSSARPAKKIQREKAGTELHASWVMVDGRASVSRESSPSRIAPRKVPQYSTPPSRRPVMSRSGLPRRPILPASRPSTSHAGSPGLRSNRPASFASSRSPVSHTQSKHESSPVNIEVQRHAARMRRRELEEDANLKRFNKQLKAMIKEGKEALGTKYEVQLGEEMDEMVDEGYAEGEFYDERGKG